MTRTETVAMQANAAAGTGEGVVTAEQRQRIEEVTAAYGAATEAIEKATVAQSIRRGRQTSLLDPQDVQIAEQLRGLYSDVGTALNSVEASAMRTNEAMRSIGSTMSSSLTTGLADILDGTKSVSAGFADMSRAIVRALEEAMIKMLIVQPLMRTLSGGLGFADGGLVGGTAPVTKASAATSRDQERARRTAFRRGSAMVNSWSAPPPWRSIARSWRRSTAIASPGLPMAGLSAAPAAGPRP
ncbi:hypothetical protein [Bradyrhizobium sp. 164]|uniref:hypothetical protein n=1 Tax=Bradyrhizobium sp. 164 TaxID=2782637 RepID=UPI001FF85182|nr:hypothetical protein [Bradyrhizobium sp. 164]MCK1593347.1 hypothetical protein [Bradyrhizobium sp. 164]